MHFFQEIRMPDVDDVILATILDFIYTGKLKMTNENALDLFMFADRMELSALFASCIKYIEAHIDAQNCLGKQVSFALKKTLKTYEI